MAARGAQAKEAITGAILVTFKDAFMNGKELRVPVMENGEEIQIKITLTAAKTNVPHDGGVQRFNALPKPTAPSLPQEANPITAEDSLEPTEEELKNLEAMLEGMMNDPSL